MKYKYKQIAKAKIGKDKYQVVHINNEYYQVQINRKKIGNNITDEKIAIKHMIAQINYNINQLDLFTNEQWKILGTV